ncbi:MAG: TfoX/Sxy family protein [Microbacterium sp.]
MPMNEAQGAMVDRVRALLVDDPTLDEKSMFGSRAFLLNDRIAVAVFRDADLLIRVDVEQETTLMLEPGAGRAMMGAKKRDMGPGWMLVDHGSLADDDRLLFWVDAARDHNRRAALS